MANKKKAMASKVSIKHLMIDKSQTNILIIIAAAIALSIFGLFATKALVAKGLYQRRVLNERHVVIEQLKKNFDSSTALFNQYIVFVEQVPNIIGGSREGDSRDSNDGNNSRIVLNALPSTYDAPALATSIEKILDGSNVVINSIQVTDDPISFSDEPQADPKSKALDLTFEGDTNFKGAERLLKDFERSIRPFDIKKLEITGTDNNLTVVANVTTYYQPAKSLNLEPTKEVK